MKLKCLHVSASMASTLLFLTTLISISITNTHSKSDTLEVEAMAVSRNTYATASAGTDVADFLDKDEELMLDSHVSRRILAQTINVNSALFDNQADCDKRKNVNCLPPYNGHPNNRCQDYQQCRASVPD